MGAKQVQYAIEKIEHTRAAAERATSEQAKGEFRSLLQIILRELGAELQSQVKRVGRIHKAGREAQWIETRYKSGFARAAGLPPQANLRVASAGDAFPTVAQLVQDMEHHRDDAEAKGRATILASQLKFLQAVNGIIKKGLASMVFRLMES